MSKMTREQFVKKLKCELSSLPSEELEGRLAFYSEMIDDRIEEGLSEEEAVAAIGDVDEIIAQLKADGQTLCKETDDSNPYSKGTFTVAEPKPDVAPTKKKMPAWAIVLIAVGSPIWISLGAAAFIILLSAYIVIWAVAGSLWALPVSLAGVCLGGIAVGVVDIVIGNALLGITLIGAAVACAGLAIFAGFGCYHLTRLAAYLSRVIAKGVIRLFRRKEKKNA
jgi:uncharacterized membrane protein